MFNDTLAVIRSILLHTYIISYFETICIVNERSLFHNKQSKSLQQQSTDMNFDNKVLIEAQFLDTVIFNFPKLSRFL